MESFRYHNPVYMSTMTRSHEMLIRGASLKGSAPLNERAL